MRIGTRIKNGIYSILFIGIFIGITGLLFSCNFNYDEAAIRETLDETLPDIYLENIKLVFERGTTVTIEADQVEIFSSQQQQIMNNVRFSEVSRNNEMRMEGYGRQIAIETDSNDVIMFGDVWIRSHRDEAEIETEYLRWNDEERIIEGSKIYPLVVRKDVGSEISGYGFRGDAEKRELSLEQTVRGQLVIDE